MNTGTVRPGVKAPLSKARARPGAPVKPQGGSCMAVSPNQLQTSATDSPVPESDASRGD